MGIALQVQVQAVSAYQRSGPSCRGWRAAGRCCPPVSGRRRSWPTRR